MITEYLNLEDFDMERALLSIIDNKLVNYFNSTLKKIPPGVRELHYKREVLNALFSFYFNNKKLFNSINPLFYREAFTAEETKSLSVKLNSSNLELLDFYCTIDNRDKKKQAEYILTSILVLFKTEKITEVYFTKEKGLKTYRKDRIYNLI